MTTQRLAEAIDQVVTGYPMGEPTSTITITGADGTEHRISGIDAGQLNWLAELVERGYTDFERSYRNDPLCGVCAHCERGPVTREVEAELAQFEETDWEQDEEMPEPSRTLEEMLTLLARDQREMRPHPSPPSWCTQPTLEVSSQSFLNTEVFGRPARRVQGVDVPEPRPLSAPIIDPAGTRWAGQHWSRPANAQDRLVGMAEDGLDCTAYVPEPFSDDPYGGDECACPFDSAVTYIQTQTPYPLGGLYTTHAWCANNHHISWSTDGG